MGKVLKFLRSRFFLSAIAILLVFIQLLVVFSLISKYSIIVTVLGYIFYIGVFLYIINKYGSPEFKLPWVIIMMLFFVMGAFIFILLTSNEQNKKTIERFKKNKEDLSLNLEQDETLEILKNENMDSYLQANYIKAATGLPCYKNTEVTYYKIGEEFHKGLLNSLKKAEKFIFMEYFIIEEGKMWDPIHEILKEKSKNGVKVYVTYDDFGCMPTLDENYYKKLNKEGINCLPMNKFRPVFSNIHNNRDHRKITVIDGIVGFTGGINLADEYINSKVKHGHWKDTAIKLEGEAVNSLTALFLEIWNTQSKIQLNPEEFMKKDYKKIVRKQDQRSESHECHALRAGESREINLVFYGNCKCNFLENKKTDSVGVVAPYGAGPEEFYGDSVGKYVYLNMLNAAKKYVYITTPYLICDYEILNTLCVCAKKGVDVRIITPHIPDKKTVLWMTQSNYEILIKNGVKIYEYTPGFIHAKQFICDDLFAICGTINLDYRSLAHHFECGTWMYKTKCIQDMKNDFLETQSVSEEIKNARYILGSWQKMIVEVMKVFFPLF